MFLFFNKILDSNFGNPNQHNNNNQGGNQNQGNPNDQGGN